MLKLGAFKNKERIRDGLQKAQNRSNLFESEFKSIILLEISNISCTIYCKFLAR